MIPISFVVSFDKFTEFNGVSLYMGVLLFTSCCIIDLYHFNDPVPVFIYLDLVCNSRSLLVLCLSLLPRIGEIFQYSSIFWLLFSFLKPL